MTDATKTMNEGSGSPPVFLVGSERSGTTLLRLMLDHHPEIAFNSEFEYVVTQLPEADGFPEIKDYREWLRNDRVFQDSGFSIDEALDYAGLARSFLEQKRVRSGKPRAGATVHYHFPKLLRIWPDARFIYLYRDGRDVANSVMRMGWAGNVYVAADLWLKAEEEWDSLRPRVADGDRIEVRYEDLIADTRTQLQRICSFMGVNYSERMFDYISTSTYEAPDVRLNYQWKRGMPERDVRLLEDKLRERLKQRGYELSNLPPLPVSRPMRRMLNLQSRIGAFRFRLARFGVGLTVTETLSRRLGLDTLHRRTTDRINEIVRANLK